MITKSKRIFLTFIFVCVSFIMFRPFVVSQMVARGDGYFGYNMLKDAVREYKKVLIIDPDNSNVMNWLGYAYERMGDIDAAISTYKKAIEADPKDIIALHDLGMIYMKDKKLKLAKEYFSKVSSIPDDNKRDTDKEHGFYYRASLYTFSVCQEGLGEIDEAIKTNEKMLEYYPGNKLGEENLKRLKGLTR